MHKCYAQDASGMTTKEGLRSHVGHRVRAHVVQFRAVAFMFRRQPKWTLITNFPSFHQLGVEVSLLVFKNAIISICLDGIFLFLFIPIGDIFYYLYIIFMVTIWPFSSILRDLHFTYVVTYRMHSIRLWIC